MILRKVYTVAGAERAWTGLQLLALAKGRRHHFKQSQLDKWAARGMCEVTDTTITLKTVDGDMVFTIDHKPGRYCLHCDEALPNENFDDPSIPQGDIRLGKAAREHMEAKHKGIASPNPQFPVGYKMKNYYGATPEDSVPTVNPKAKKSLLKRMGVEA